MASKVKQLLLKSSPLFLIGWIAINLLVIKIPFYLVFENSLGVEEAKNISRSIHGIILIYLSILLIRGLELNDLAGIKLFRLKNPLLLIIPFIYPMLLALPKIFKADLSGASGVYLFLVFLAIFCKALAEEYAFRGLVQSYLIKKYNSRLSVILMVNLAALIFAGMHLVNLARLSYVDVINQVIAAYYFGVFFGALLLMIKNVFVIGIIHGLVNIAFQIDMLYKKAGTGPTTREVESSQEIIRIIVIYCLVFFPLWVIGMVILWRAKRKQVFHSA